MSEPLILVPLDGSELAEAAFKTQQRLLGFNPRKLTQEDIEAIYRAAA